MHLVNPDDIPKSVRDLHDHLENKVKAHAGHVIRLQSTKEIKSGNDRYRFPQEASDADVAAWQADKIMPANDHDLYVGTRDSHMQGGAETTPVASHDDADAAHTKTQNALSKTIIPPENQPKEPPKPANDDDETPQAYKPSTNAPANFEPPKPANESVNYLNESYEEQSKKYPADRGGNIDLEADEKINNPPRKPGWYEHSKEDRYEWDPHERRNVPTNGVWTTDALGKERQVNDNAHNEITSEVHEPANLVREDAKRRAERETETPKRKSWFNFNKKPYVIKTDDLHESRKQFRYGDSSEYRKVALFSDIINEMEVRDLSGKVKKVKTVAVRMASGQIENLPPGKSGSSGH
jgi:hypothetical protein